MVIKKETPITLAKVVALSGDNDKGKLIKGFIKNFNKTPLSKAEEIEKELKGLDLIKLKDFHIVKIIDFMPEDVSELNKVIADASLDSDEMTKILDVVRKY